MSLSVLSYLSNISFNVVQIMIVKEIEILSEIRGPISWSSKWKLSLSVSDMSHLFIDHHLKIVQFDPKIRDFLEKINILDTYLKYVLSNLPFFRNTCEKMGINFFSIFYLEVHLQWFWRTHINNPQYQIWNKKYSTSNLK